MSITGRAGPHALLVNFLDDIVSDLAMKLSGRLNVLAIFGPGILLAATGVGTGDLAAASFSGNKLGVAVLWAVMVGAAMKFVLNEGLARWQLATDRTILEGCAQHVGLPFQIVFLLYFLPWSFFVGSALMGSCGVAAHAILPVFEDPDRAVLVFGALHSVLGLTLARIGGYWLFEKIMSFCIAVMFFTVLTTVVLLEPDWSQIVAGLFIPSIPEVGGEEITWTLALMGGVGGTVTILCYGYWIREVGREGLGALKVCRIDIGVAYFMTALFGMAMVIIGSRIEVTGRGAGLVVALADQLERPLGAAGRWTFLVGAWGALFSSLLGVWQSVPYLFADFVGQLRPNPESGGTERVSTKSRTYQYYQYALASVPFLALSFSFREIQKYYAFVSAFFLPLLALALLYLNGQSRLVGRENRNGPVTVLILALLILFFAVLGWWDIQNRF